MSHTSGGCLARLTRTTVVRGAALTVWSGPSQLTAFLYRAGGAAPAVNRDRRWAQYLITLAERSVTGRLHAYEATRTEHWSGWTAAGVDPVTLVHKIYLSPTVAALPTAVPAIFEAVLDLGVPAWKIGADAAGLHRADKIVLYLSDAEQADRAAYALASRLVDVPAQGVPFSGQVGDSGLVSRGCDIGGTSWRSVVCSAVSTRLVESRTALGPAAPADRVVRVALRHLADAGYDTDLWSPSPAVRELVPA